MTKGVVLSVASSCQFGLIFYFVTFLKPLTGWEVFGWRTVFITTFLTLFMLLHRHDWRLARELAARARADRRLLWALPLSSFLLGLQQWLYVWGPANGRAMEMSIGYFLLPMTMVLCGRVVYKEKLTFLQKCAIVCALAGVANQLYQAGGFHWTTLVICLGFPPYFVLRRHFRFDDLGGLWFDMILMVPLAVWYIAAGPAGMHTILHENDLFVLLPVFGALSAVALITYILASKFLPLGLFGLLSYVEPVLLTVVAILIGGSISGAEIITYAGIWLAVILLVLDGLRNVFAHHRVLKRHHGSTGCSG